MDTIDYNFMYEQLIDRGYSHEQIIRFIGFQNMRIQLELDRWLEAADANNMEECYVY